MTDTEPPVPPHRSPAEIRRARRSFLAEAAIEAEKNTGRKERTDDEARHSLWMRFGRLVAGWLLVLLGLAGLVLPGPGWLIVLLGLTLLPYRWTDNLIRIIRRRIPGIPEDGRIPTRTWIIMGVAVLATTSASVWWGLRDQGDDADTADGATTTTVLRPQLVTASTDEPNRKQLAAVYGSVAADVTDQRTSHVTSTDLCSAVQGGDADLVLLTDAEVVACFGGTSTEEARQAALVADVKVFGPVVVEGVTYLPAVRTESVALDDEPAELALDGVSEQISAGSEVSGDPADRARTLMEAAGVLK